MQCQTFECRSPPFHFEPPTESTLITTTMGACDNSSRLPLAAPIDGLAHSFKGIPFRVLRKVFSAKSSRMSKGFSPDHHVLMGRDAVSSAERILDTHAPHRSSSPWPSPARRRGRTNHTAISPPIRRTFRGKAEIPETASEPSDSDTNPFTDTEAQLELRRALHPERPSTIPDPNDDENQRRQRGAQC